MTKRLGLIFCVLLAPTIAGASTIVRFDTTFGDIDVRLFDTATPASVANFLNYVTDGDYDESFIHRSIPGFVIQGGGFRFPEAGLLETVPTDPPVINEPGLTNIRGTLAYAKLAGDPNSATSGWFFNLSDSNADLFPGPQLNLQNGGFTVFGAVLGDGLSVIDQIASRQTVNVGGAFASLPVRDGFVPPQTVPPSVPRGDLVFINSIDVISFADGDYNFDGVVNGADYAVWRNQFGASLRISDQPATASGVEADGNGDGVVDRADYQVWLNHVGSTSQTQSLSAAIPEPSSLLLVGLLLASSACRRA